VVTRHATRFLVATSQQRIVACGELAPLSHSLAEIRSLVVATRYQGSGIGRRLVTELRRKARLDGFHRMCAFAHQPAYFAGMGFSIVPHGWLPEKVGLDCVTCRFFRHCGQVAMLDALAQVGDGHVLPMPGALAHA
jgi:N-acetylglutamate synthase-like GNAT family acetyltransferase